MRVDATIREDASDELRDWRCPFCRALQSQVALRPGSIVRSKCWKCKKIVELHAEAPPPYTRDVGSIVAPSGFRIVACRPRRHSKRSE